MYRCPRLVDVPVVVELPATMYKMPVFNSEADVKWADSYYPRAESCKNCPEAAALEMRQEAVLERLHTLKQRLDLLQSTRVAAAATAATAATPLPSLGAAAHSSPAKGQESDLLRQQESVLYRLGRLKERLSQLSEESATMQGADEPPMTLAQRHRGILEVIAALREEMRFLAELQKWMDERLEKEEEKKRRRKEEEEEEEEEGLKQHHQAVLCKLQALREELLRLVSGFQTAATLEERQFFTSVCSCLTLPPADFPSVPSSVSLPPSIPSLCPSTTSSSPSYSKTESLLSLLPPPPPPLPSSSSSSSSPTEYSTVHDLVVSASPSTPPLSLLLLRRLLTQAGRPVHSTSRLHSTVAQVRPELHAAFTDAPLSDRGKHAVAFSVQWTDTATPNLMVNPLHQTKIAGEGNLIRYVSRLFPATSPFNYEAVGTFASMAEADALLDRLEGQLAGGGRREFQEGLREVASRLQRSAFLCGSSCGIVDVLAWSLLRRCSGGPSGVGRGQEGVAAWLAEMDRLADVDLDSIIPPPPQQQQQQQQQHQQQQQQNNTKKTKAATAASMPSKQTTRQDFKREAKQLSSEDHMGRVELEAYLDKLGIPYQVREHRQVFTVEALMQEVAGAAGVITKNLFLRDKKQQLYLLSARHDSEVDLKTVAKQAGTKDLRFADEPVLLATLGVQQGCVSALALANDSSAHSVRFLVERSAVDPSVPLIHFHPMSNSATLGLSPQDLLGKFLAATGHQPVLVDL